MTELNVPLVPMGDGQSIPQLGFGTYLTPPDVSERAVSQALEVGYRHIDTAAMYGNEPGVGAAIAASGIPRDQLFVVTKLWRDSHEPERARVAINASLEKLGLDHVDLYLIHWPAALHSGELYVAAWDALQEFKREGLATSIGVCNFSASNIDHLSGEVPALNQVELHPTFAQLPLRAEMARRGIPVESWSPLGRGHDISHPVIRRVASEAGRTPAQVIIRWHLQTGLIVIPKSVTPDRIAENAQVFDFELTLEQMADINAIDAANRVGTDPATV